MNAFLRRIFPPLCLLCGAAGTKIDICSDCRNDLPWMQQREKLELPEISTQIISAFHYTTPIDSLIINLKFNQKIVYAALLGELFADYLFARQIILPELIIPVPLHSNRLRQRGYNQAVELARPIAHRRKIPLVLRACQRIRATLAQTQLDATARKNNVENAFAINRAGYELIHGKRIAIFDDVITTGYTMQAIARVVRHAGARDIQIWSLARA